MAEVVLERSGRSARPVRELFDAALAPTVRALCDLRLGITAALALLMHQHLGLTELMILVLVVPLNWLPLRSWGRTPLRFTDGWRFPVADVLVTVALTAATLIRGETATLGLAYLFVSALMMGAMVTPFWAGGWSLTVACGALFIGVAAPSDPVPLMTWWLAPTIGCLAVCGLRMRRRLGEIDMLSQRLAEARSRERAAQERLTIAQDLHDTVAKSVAGIRLLSESLVADLENGGTSDERLARVILDSADQASREARMVLDELRAPADGDLVDMLQAQVLTWACRTDTRCSIECRASSMTMDADGAWQIQRILGELLTNVEKHARATAVTVFLGVVAGQLTMRVVDNGKGLDRWKPGDSPTGHYGLLGIRQRADALNGVFEIGPAPSGPGTAASVRVPVAA